MDTPLELVFVYGTLRRGGSQHGRMAGAEFVATGVIRGRLYHIDWFPGLVVDDAGSEIIGEVYSVSLAVLAELDAFEGGDYRRVRVNVRCGDDSVPDVAAWIWEWLGPVDESRRITSGDWVKEVQG
jgi:gamma-glutamylaminecyclotransferase